MAFPGTVLVQKFARLFQADDPRSLPTVVGSDDHVLPPAQDLSAQPVQEGSGGASGGRGIGLFGASYDDGRERAKCYAEYDMIDDNVPEMSRALSLLAQNSMCGEPGANEGFRLEYDDATSQEDRDTIEDLLLRRLAMQERKERLARCIPKYGDFFGELVVGRDGTIWSMRYLEPRLTHRVHDQYGRLDGFRFDGFVRGNGVDADNLLQPWQVVHARYDAQEGYRYGRSLFACMRALAYRIIAVRDALAYESVNHATARNLVMVARPQRWDPTRVESWLDSMTDRLARESVVDSNGNLNRRMLSILNGQDVVMAYPTGPDGKGTPPVVHALANAPLGDLVGSAEHFQDLVIAGTGIPAALLGVNRGGDGGISGGKLAEQVDQLARQLRSIQKCVSGLMLETVRRQFILYRRPLEEDAVRIVMPNLTRVDEHVRAQIQLLKGQAMLAAAQAGMPADYIWCEIAWSGDQQVARDRAQLYGWDPANWAMRSMGSAGTGSPAPAQEPALGPDGKPVPKLPPPGKGKTRAEAVSQIVTEIHELERARLALRGAVMSNRAVRFGRGE